MKLILCLAAFAGLGLAQPSEPRTKAESTAAAPAKLTDAQKAKAMFEKFMALEGKWGGKSTKGWEDTCTIKAIANGSAVMETEFEAHPGEMMVTMYHMDGDVLMLTHYCAAKNQPRLKATQISDDLKTVTFTFMDGTNIPTRDKGHMDKAVYVFESADAHTTRWTWYQDGQEKWMEEIRRERVKEASAK